MTAPPAPPEAVPAPGALALLLALAARPERAALPESEERYRLLVELCPEPIAVHQDARMVYANAAAAALLGASEPAELVGRPVLALVAPGSRPAVRERMEKLYATGTPLPFEERTLQGVDGRRVRAEIAGVAVRWNGAPAIQLVAKDVTERRRAQAQARRRAARRRETERLDSLGRLAGELAREFGALLGEAVGGADALLGELPLGSPHAERLRAIRRSALRACRLADRLGALSGEGGAGAEPVHLSGLCADTSEALEAAAHGAELSYDLMAALPPVRCDALRLRRALLALVHFCARRAGPEGAVSIRTGVRKLDAAWLARARGTPRAAPGPYVYLEVADDGPPLPGAQRRGLFEAFPREAEEGGGMALATALAAVRPHGGHARAESGRGRGLRVTLALPAERARPASPGARGAAPRLRSLPPA